MEDFEVKILGCGSALPTTRHASSSQLVRLRDKMFMIDCGEGTQLQMRRYRQGFSRLGHIFISHLHGDHCFGLIGLISTLGMLGRGSAATLHIHSFPELETLLRPQIDYFCRDMAYEVVFHPFQPDTADIIYEDRSLTVQTIPLNHRIACSGFLFREKPSPRHILREMIDHYHIPISQINCIRNGADFTLEDGSVIPNDWLTAAPAPPRSYAYCCDTAPKSEIIPIIKGVDVLYHDATFATEDLARAKQTFHSTSAGAASIAAKAEVKRLVLGHFSARYEDEELLLREAREVFPSTELAEEGMSIHIV
ncbi:MAG: ribonuclease Z [Bacteroidaceae bacterium]|nr:ribonuclease Z [Bacteroidaceae bacterium]